MQDQHPEVYQPYPKIPRLSREITVTEKIDGSCGQVFVWDMAHQPKDHKQNLLPPVGSPPDGVPWLFVDGPIYIAAGSKNRWVTIGEDNFGFAKWVVVNAPALAGPGHGRHFGEWWGLGINRNYGLSERRFSLFNTDRWAEALSTEITMKEFCPDCCHVVPVLYRGKFSTASIEVELELLENQGSKAAPGFMQPEGVVVWHTAANHGFKKTIENDEKPKTVVDSPGQ